MPGTSEGYKLDVRDTASIVLVTQGTGKFLASSQVTKKEGLTVTEPFASDDITPGSPCASLDFAHAYKHVPILEGRVEFATILAAPPAGTLKVSALRAQPFGSKRAPSNRPRATNFIKWLMLTVFRIVISVCVEDVLS